MFLCSSSVRAPAGWPLPRCLPIDLLGSRFTVLTRNERWCAAAASTSVAAHCIRSDAWAANTELGPDGALLVRPDDFVGWRTDQLPADPEAALHQALSRILSR
jgi:hypothetical protein